jgi:hypothetical protein
MPRPRPTFFEVRYSAKPNRDNHWRIVEFINGNRTQYWFKSEQDAKAAADDKNAESRRTALKLPSPLLIVSGPLMRSSG